MQLIDKKATLKLLQENRDNEVSTGVIGAGIKAGYDAAMIVISNYATVIEEHKHGHWGKDDYKCSLCGAKRPTIDTASKWIYLDQRYCYNCGAKMDEEV